MLNNIYSMVDFFANISGGGGFELPDVEMNQVEVFLFFCVSIFCNLYHCR